MLNPKVCAVIVMIKPIVIPIVLSFDIIYASLILVKSMPLITKA